MNTDQLRQSTYGLLSAMAQSGDYLDCWALEAKLRTIGFSDDQSRLAMSDAEDRTALLALCLAARKPAREDQRMKDESAFRQLIENI